MKNFVIFLYSLLFYEITLVRTLANKGESSKEEVNISKTRNSLKSLKKIVVDKKILTNIFRFTKLKTKGECTELYGSCEGNGESGDGFFKCFSGTCLKTTGTSCVNSRACGYELMCVGGFCEEALSCKKIGQGCSKNIDCCTNLLCSESSKTCGPCYECRELHESCYLDSQCRGWSLHCENGYCAQCKDLMYKKGCIKYGYFCRVDEECRPNLRCFYLKFKDEYLCLGAKDFSEEEPENYKETEKKKSRLKAFHKNNSPSEYTERNFVLKSISQNPIVNPKDSLKINISKANSISFENKPIDQKSKSKQNVETSLEINDSKTKKLQMFTISKKNIISSIQTSNENPNLQNYGEAYNDYLQRLKMIEVN